MKCLSERLSTCNPSEVLWLSEPEGVISVRKLKAVLDKFDLSYWHGKRVAIGELSVVEFLSTLVFLDGLAQAIVILPIEDDNQTSEDRVRTAAVDIVVEHEGLGFSKLLAQYSEIPEFNANVRLEVAAAGLTMIETAWLLPTSGTTGTPKLIKHKFESLTRSMASRHLGNNYIWGSLYSLRRYAGLQVFLQSWMGGTPLLLNAEGADLNDVLTNFISLQCNSISATPSMWRKLAMHPLFDRLSLKQITLGGEIVDQPVLDMLSKRFPSARITHIYASTEAGVGFAVRDGLAGFPIDYLAHPPLGIPIRINDHGHLQFFASRDHSLIESVGSEWIDSGDVVEIQLNRVNFLGRANGSINVGGNKVMPEEIESVIKELPEVAFVQVFARKNAILGNLVEAAITPAPGTIFDLSFKKKIIAHCRTRLISYKVPAIIVAADAIQLTPLGKIPRKNVE